MYYLMNKDEVVGEIEITGPSFSPIFKIEWKSGVIPLGFRNIGDWLESRVVARNRNHIKRMIRKYMSNTLEGIISVTHCVSINDTYWIKMEDDNLNWADVSPYDNELNEVLSAFAIDGVVNTSIILSSPSPEVTTDGSFPKCCVRDRGSLYMIKRGLTSNGIECYCEVLSCGVYSLLTKDAVDYELISYHNKLASRCKIFTTPEIGFVPYAKLCRGSRFEDIVDFYKSIGSYDKFAGMVVADALCVNGDRHACNHGVFVNNDTQSIISMSTVFDQNLAFIPEAREDEYDEIIAYAKGSDDSYFKEMLDKAKYVMTDEIKRKLKILLYYQLPFAGDDVFTKKRVMMINEIIRGHARRLLE